MIPERAVGRGQARGGAVSPIARGCALIGDASTGLILGSTGPGVVSTLSALPVRAHRTIGASLPHFGPVVKTQF